MQYYLRRLVDQQGTVIDIMVQPKRDGFVAMRLLRKLLQRSRRRPRASQGSLRTNWVAGKVNSAGKLYLVIESVCLDDKHPGCSADPAAVAGVGALPPH